MQNKSPRHLSRNLAVQGIYSIKINQCTVSEIEDFLRSINSTIFDNANYQLMHELIEQTLNNFSANVELYTPYLNRKIDEINLIEQVILALAATELQNNLSVPATVVINEAIELTKLYGAEDSYKFINGLVDKLAHEIRKSEMSTQKSYPKRSK
ncbi:MAG: transcription antitermination factor NusB [Burkholderiales bacterium]|nr:transcription antitermination factor NusB [Burkholderiales bacterium]